METLVYRAVSCQLWNGAWPLTTDDWLLTYSAAGDGFGDVGDECFGVLDHFEDEPGEAEDEDGDHGDDFGNEGDGLVLNLSERLSEADNEADEYAGEEDGR